MTSVGLLDFDLYLLEQKMQGSGSRSTSRRNSLEIPTTNGYKSDSELFGHYERIALEQKGIVVLNGFLVTKHFHVQNLSVSMTRENVAFQERNVK